MIQKIFLAFLFFGLCVALKPLEPSPQVKATGDEEKYKLDGKVVPTHYVLELTTHIDKFDINDEKTFTFEGDVTITINVKEDLDNIVLLAKNITINNAELFKPGDTTTPIALVFKDGYDAETNKQTLTPNPAQKITKGDGYTLHIAYSGIHGNDMHGFYRSSYENENKETKWLVTTQFEAYDARRAFPCFDEPEWKATYEITIKVNTDLVKNKAYGALSNMPLDGNPTEKDGYTVYKFQKSAMPLSSYLVAFIVSDFKSTTVDANSEDTTPFKTWGQGRFIAAGQADLSQKAGPLALTTMKDLTGVPFGYPKVDQIGIPDFSAGAMENWGLVTYRERLIFYDAVKNPTSQKQSVVTVTTHELAHQWFGDLVTLWWWADIWLNEGFATYFEYHATEKYTELTGDWKIVAQMVVNELQAGALAADAQPTARPLTKPVYLPGEIDANFDSVAYSKGGSVIRMWRHIMGDADFYGALGDYLTAFKGKNAHPEDLLKAFDARVQKTDPNAAYLPSTDFKSWHIEAGYPVISVARDDKQLSLTQERFFVSAPSDASTVKWTVPITYTTSEEKKFDIASPKGFLKPADDKPFAIPVGKESWVVINIQQTGYYRVNYDQIGWEALIKQLTDKHEDIHEINRAQILDDIFWLSRSTHKNFTQYETALRLSLYLEKEESLIPWTAALNSFSYLYGKLDNDSRPLLKSHIEKVISKQFDRLTLSVGDKDAHTDKLLRSQVAAWACKLGIESCVNASQALGLDTDKMHPDVKTTVLCTNIREGNAEKWDSLWKKYQETTDNAEQVLLMSALGCSRDTTVINKFLDITIQADCPIRKQDLPSAFSAVISGNPENVQLGLTFAKAKFVQIADMYGGLDPLGSVLLGLAGKLSSDEDKEAMLALNVDIQKSEDPRVIDARTSSAAAVTIVNSNNAWVAEKHDSITTWLKSTYSDSSHPGGASGVTATTLVILIPAVLAFIFGQ